MALNTPDPPQAEDAITAFDSVYTTNSIQILKLALPLLCEPARPFLAALVKAQELSYCYQLLQRTNMRSFSVMPQQLETFLREAQQFCTPEQRSLFRTLEQFQKAMRLLEKMQLLNQEMPFSEDGDLMQLLLFMPQLFGQEAQPGGPQKKDPGGECATCRDAGSNDSAEECAAGRDTGGKTPADHEKNTPPPLPSMLTEALTPHQKELFAGYMQRFSDN